MRSASNDDIIEVEDLSVRYPSRDEYSIKDLSFNIKKGEFVWLSGDSASGKSTLMNCLCGFIPQIIPAEVEGNIRLNGRSELNTLELAREISMVHQDPETQFCTEIVEDEIAFGLENRRLSRRKIDKRVKTTLEDLNCSELRHRELHTLSGGEKQKIAIASMLVLNPKVLILDEPTANLDPVSMDEVLQAIENVSRKSEELTIILAEHRIGGLEDQVDRVLRLEGGRLKKIIDDFYRSPSKVKKRLADYSYPDYERNVKRRKKPILRIDGLNYRVGGNHILKDIDLEIEQNEIIALMGRNGCGKTTLIKHIAGLSEIQEGTIRIFGKDMTPSNKIPPWELGKQLGYVFQNPNHQIFENTVESEMLFGPKNFGKGVKKGEDRLRKFMKEGLDKGTHPHNLSFGQKRRLNTYSSSLHDPSLIIVDEPFSGQDHKNALMIADILDEFWRRGKILIIVTHELDFAKRFCTRAVVMKEGKMAYDGDPGRLEGIT